MPITCMQIDASKWAWMPDYYTIHVCDSVFSYICWNDQNNPLHFGEKPVKLTKHLLLCWNSSINLFEPHKVRTCNVGTFLSGSKNVLCTKRKCPEIFWAIWRQKAMKALKAASPSQTWTCGFRLCMRFGFCIHTCMRPDIHVSEKVQDMLHLTYTSFPYNPPCWKVQWGQRFLAPASILSDKNQWDLMSIILLN